VSCWAFEDYLSGGLRQLGEVGAALVIKMTHVARSAVVHKLKLHNYEDFCLDVCSNATLGMADTSAVNGDSH
jgi:hypothetical protein